MEVYQNSFGEAKQSDKIDQWRKSRKLNRECKNSIEQAIRENFDGMYLNGSVIDSVLDNTDLTGLRGFCQQQ